MLSALCTAAVCLPVPIGAGPEYHPPPRWPLAGQAAFHGLRGDIAAGERVHIELFANGRVIIVPGGIGVAGGRTTRYGFVTAALGRAGAWTLQPGGIVHLERPGMTLGDVFDVWGRALAPDRLLEFRGAVRVHVNGMSRPGDPRTLVLRDGDQVVVQVGPYVPPHPTFVFRPPVV